MHLLLVANLVTTSKELVPSDALVTSSEPCYPAKLASAAEVQIVASSPSANSAGPSVASILREEPPRLKWSCLATLHGDHLGGLRYGAFCIVGETW